MKTKNDGYGRNAKLTPVSELWFGNIDSKPISYDWTKGYGEAWESFEASRCEECGEAVVGTNGETHSTADSDIECGGHLPQNEGPMMSYYYPLTEFRMDLHEAAKRLVDLPLCVVSFIEAESVGLALTGGGMDFSWEICEAFMRLGYLPPIHFCDLPQMAGRGTSTLDRWIISGCRRSLQGAKAQVGRALRRLRENFKPVSA